MPGSQTTSDDPTFSPEDELPGWGHVGRPNRFVRIPTATLRSYGVKRTVSFGHRYVNTLPAGTLLLPSWSAETSGGSFLMDVQASSRLQFSSLGVLARRLQKRHRDEGRLTSETDGRLDSELSLLNWLCDRLLSVAVDLHANGCNLGLTDPDNILYYKDGDGDVRLVLPDLFFSYNGPPPYPTWMLDRGDFSFLWTEEGDTDPFRLQPLPTDNSRDIRLLARLFAWALTGEQRRKLEPDERYSALGWAVLRRAGLAGSNDPAAILDVTSLQAALRVPGYYLSDHFREPIRASVRDRQSGEPWNIWKPLRNTGVVAVLLGGGLFLASRAPGLIPIPPPPPKPSWLCKECTGSSPLSKELRDRQEPLVTAFHQTYGYSPEDRSGLKVTSSVLEKQFANLEEQINALRIGAQSLDVAGQPATAAEEACLASEARRLRDGLGEQWNVLKLAAKKDTLPTPTEMYTRFRDLYVTLKKLPFVKLEPSSWEQDYEQTLELVYGISPRG